MEKVKAGAVGAVDEVVVLGSAALPKTDVDAAAPKGED